QNLVDYFGLRSCKEICADADADLNYPIVENGKAKMGGVVCDSDGKKCGCPFRFPVPGGNSGDIYHPGECPALDDIITKHENGHKGQVDCQTKGKMCPGIFKPNVDQQKAECDLWKKDIPRLEKALKGANGRCAQVI